MVLFFRKLFIFGGILLTAALFNTAAKACSCIRSETVEKEFSKYPNVAVLKVRSVNDKAETYSLTVEKVFKGDLKVGEVLNFKRGLICAWGFDKNNVGADFLFYLDEKPSNGEMWTAGFCTRSGRVDARSDDLLYLEKEKRMRGKTRLSGTLYKLIEKPENGERYFYYPLANHKIRVVGKGRNIEVETDANGTYEIYDLPPGKYKIFPAKPDGFRFSSDDNFFPEVEIKARSHTEQGFYFEISNSVSGNVFDQNGAPLANVCLDLEPVNNEKAKNYSKGMCTNKSGFFEIDAIPEGSYILVVNRDGIPTLNEPFGKFYYPNVKTVEEATIISVRADYFLKDLKIVPPEVIEKRTLSGTLLFSDGQPVADETVSLIKFDDIMRYSTGSISSEFQVKTDRNGRFSIVTLKGQQGVLIGSLYSFVGEYVNCLEIDNKIREKGSSVQRLDTAGKTVYEAGSLSAIELRFPFPGCKKAKID